MGACCGGQVRRCTSSSTSPTHVAKCSWQKPTRRRAPTADARGYSYPVFVRRPVRVLYPVHTSCPSPISSKFRVPCYAKISPTGPKSPSWLGKPAATKPQQQAQRLRPERRSHSDDCPKRKGSSATWTLLPRRRISITPEPPNAYVLPRLSGLP